MNVISGVDQAQQGEVVTNQTATASDNAQSGFASRTGADRDTEEEMLTELAQYTAELAVQAITSQDAIRIAGPLAFWPEGMDPQDVLTMVEVEIEAGTTGKPGARADKEAWATLLPLIQNSMVSITQLESMPTPPNMALAKGQRALLDETLKRLNDRLSIDKILPPAPPLVPGLPAPGAAVPPLPGAAPAAPVGNGTVNNTAVTTPQPPSP
jgi:hypothetical protein